VLHVLVLLSFDVPTRIAKPPVFKCPSKIVRPVIVEAPCLGRSATVECPAIVECPASVRFCRSATCFKYLLPSSKILCCLAWVACWFFLLALFANCMALNASSSLRSSSS
jgi:hypothetical protein